jgi:hypothetical protein
LEVAWQTNIATWQKDISIYCGKVKEYSSEIQNMLHHTGIMSPNGTLHQKGQVYTTFHGSKQVNPLQVFSQHVYSFHCLDGNYTMVGRIEPLVAGLRHPYAGCSDFAKSSNESYGHVIARNFILFDNKESPNLHGVYPSLGAHPRVLATYRMMFDLGARTWPEGLGISQQAFLYVNYLTRGIAFDRHLMWEARQATGEEIFAHVPRHLMPHYQYYNVPVDTNFTDPGHPFNVLKALAMPWDYVVMKIDIDSPGIERELFNKIAEDSSLSELIDELYYEPHVMFEPMLHYWGGASTVEQSQTMADMYVLFSKLRHSGVRMHGWP